MGDAERRCVIALSCKVQPHPALIPAALQELQQRVLATIQRYRGRRVPIIADGVWLFYWGFPRSEEWDARCAVKAGLELAAIRQASSCITCGIDAACVTSEGPGRDLEKPRLIEAELRRAKLLRPSQDPGTLVIGQSVAALLGADLELADNQPTGSCEPLRVVGIRRSKAQPVPILFGRSAECERLAETWSQVIDGQSHCVALTGEAGIGKSALLRVVESRCAESGGLWIEIDCRPDYPNTSMNALEHGLRRLGVTPASDLSPQDVLDWIGSEARRRPMALVFEDVECADRATLDVIAGISTRLGDLGPVCLIITSRSSQLPQFKTPVSFSHLALRRLGMPDIDALVARHPQSAEIPSEMRKQIAIRSEGVPMFAQELVGWYAGAGRPDAPDGFLKPSRLNAVLSARLDAVGDLRTLAQAASVIGRDFELSTLATMLRMDDAQLAAGLAGLIEGGVIEALPGPWRSNTYRFSHALLKDAAYASILMTHRCNLHRTVAEILSQDAVRQADHTPETIAAHFTAAHDDKGAFIWWSKAGQRAVSLAAPHSAADHFKRALAARRRDPEASSLAAELEIVTAMAVQLMSIHGYASDEVFVTLQRCVDLVRRLPGSPAEFDVMWMLHSSHLTRGDVAKAIWVGERLLATAERNGSPEQCMMANCIQGLAKLLCGRLDAAFAHYDVVLGIYDERRHAGLRFQYGSDHGALAHAHLAWAKAIALQLDGSARHAELALELASRLQHPHTSAQVMCVLAARAQTLGNRHNASALAYAAKSLSDRQEFPYWRAWASMILAWAKADCGAAGLAKIDRAIISYVRTGAHQMVPYAMLLYGEAALAQRSPKKALTALQAGWLAAEQNGLLLYAPELLRLQATAQMQLGGSSQHTAAILKKACALADDQVARLFYARASTALDTPIIHQDYARLEKTALNAV